MGFIKTFLGVALFFFTATCFAQQISIASKYYTIPVLKNKDNNTLVRLKIDLPQNPREFFMTRLSLDFSGTTDLNDIKSVSVFCNTDSLFLNAEKIFQTGSFALYNRPVLKHSLQLQGNLRFDKNKINYLWVTISLNETAKLQNRISVAVTGIIVNSQSFKINYADVVANRVGTAVRQFMQDNVHTSRIPGIATAANGNLLAVYDARYDSRRDLQGDIDIALNRSTDRGNTWLPMQVIIDKGSWGNLPEKFNGVSDACILVDKNTRDIFVAGLWMHGILDSSGAWITGLTDTSSGWNHQWRNKGSQPGFSPKQTSQFLIVKSTDNGKTWSEPVNITKMCKKEDWWLFAPAPGSGITLADGTLVFPTQGRDEEGHPFSNITYSKDNGKTWVTTNAAVKEATSEHMVVQLQDGSIMANMRTNANKGLTVKGNGRAIAVTYDMGKTWKEHATSRNALPEPVCMASLYKHEYYKSGKKQSVLFFLNPNSATHRKNITLKVSYDDGKTWPQEEFILLDELSGNGYSCITTIDSDTIGVLYESSQAQLVFQQINIKDTIK